SRPAWHLYVIRHAQADALIDALTRTGVGARAYYRTPVHAQPPMAPYAPPAGSLPATDEAARTHLALPMSAALTAEQVEAAAAAARPAPGGAARTHRAVPMSAALPAEQVEAVAAAVRDAGLALQ